ncbi:MAG: hypothetical protein K9I82_16200 [Chitinophagaceae bacterium]|nr:hypothetical protein [Chitinophagaceae bacterium]
MKFIHCILITIYSIIFSSCKNDVNKNISVIDLEIIKNNFNYRIQNVNNLIKQNDLKNYSVYQDSLRIIRISINDSELEEYYKNKFIIEVDSLNNYIDSQIEARKKVLAKTNAFTQLNIYKSFTEIYNSKRRGSSKITELNGRTSSDMPGGIFTGRAILNIYNNNFAQLTSCIDVIGRENCVYFSGDIIKNNDTYFYDSYHKTGYGDTKSPFKIKFKKNKSGEEYIELDNKKGNINVKIYID